MRGVFYADRLARGPEAARLAMRQRARDTLSDLAAVPDGGLHARRALATLASLDYREGDFLAARAGFEAYLAAYPDTAWSWVAAMGIGQSHQALGEMATGSRPRRSWLMRSRSGSGSR